jgi:predicted RNA-binding Zn ribbon-like protein
MSSHLVDGVPLPDAVAGHPALDFCNTRAGWGTPEPKEYLTDYRALALWTRDAGLLASDTVDALLAGPVAPVGGDHVDGGHRDEGRDLVAGPAARQVLLYAIGLRDALYAAALGAGAGGDWSLLSRWAARARVASRLVPGTGGGPARWLLDPGPTDRTAPLELPLLAVAASAADLLTSPLAGCVAACPGAGCGWLFADPRGRRRWCSMAVCGNRAKARRHAERSSSRGRPPVVELPSG